MASETDLRDRLAIDRTRLANERTLLAYVRTALALVAAGAGTLQLVPTTGGRIGGWALILLGAAALPLGFWRFLSVRIRLAQHHEELSRASETVGKDA